MMAAIFAFMSLALVAAYRGSRSVMLVLIIVCLSLATAEFLWEIYSPEDGFRLPWLQALTRGANLT